MVIRLEFLSTEEMFNFINTMAGKFDPTDPAIRTAAILPVVTGAAVTDTPEEKPVAKPITEEPVTEEKPIDIDELIRRFIALKDKAGKETVRAVLTELGVNKVSEIPEDAFDKAAEMVKAAMEESGEA